MMPPCKDCPDRYTACHDHCAKYKEWKADLIEAKKRNQEQRYILYSPETIARNRTTKRFLKDSLRGRKKY